MNLTFIHFADFASDFKHHRLSDEDMQALEAVLQKSPEAGAIVPGTGGVRKIRFAPPSRHGGKREGEGGAGLSFDLQRANPGIDPILDAALRS